MTCRTDMLAGLGATVMRLFLLVCLLGKPVNGTGAETLTLSGDHSYEETVFRELPYGSRIDARDGMFHVANSRNPAPGPDRGCDVGPLPVNLYPLRIYDSPAVQIDGGRFDGTVPLDTDWLHTYCNSAAIGLWDSAGATSTNLRVRRAWDALRFAGRSDGFTVRDGWFSEIRDDCLENDFLLNGIIEDVLFDGCFVGISVRSADSRNPDGSGRTVTLSGVMIRMQPYLYKNRVVHGAPIKADEHSPVFEVYDSVFAMGGSNAISPRAIEMTWNRMGNCDNNLLLLENAGTWPEGIMRPPDCFRILYGEKARAAWSKIRRNWIDCHPGIPRFETDPDPDSESCSPDDYGGQYAN